MAASEERPTVGRAAAGGVSQSSSSHELGTAARRVLDMAGMVVVEEELSGVAT